MEDDANKPADDDMMQDSHTPTSDDAVSNRSDDTALDEAPAADQGAPLAEHVGHDNEDREVVSDATPEQDAEEQAAYEAAEAQSAEGDNDDADVADTDIEETAEEPARAPRGPVHEEPVTEEEIRMDWYILKVQSNRERSIAEALERKMRIEGLDRFFDQVIVPTEKVTEFKGGKKKVVERKLYPGYIVVHMHINDDTWFAVRETSGVGDFTGAGGKPTPMLAHEVAKIIQTEEEETSEAPKLDIRFHSGDKVKVKEGNFESFEGEVNTIDEASGRVTVMINIFGRSTPVELEYWQIEAV
jgi:transcription termination/antitermination protein NusG